MVMAMNYDIVFFLCGWTGGHGEIPNGCTTLVC